MRTELDALVSSIEKRDPQLLECAAAVALFARRRGQRLGGSPSVTLLDIEFVLAAWTKDFAPLNPGPHDLGFHPATLYALLGFRFEGTDRNGRERYDSVVDAVLRGEVAPPPKPLRHGERPWRWTMPECARRVVELVVQLQLGDPPPGLH